MTPVTFDTDDFLRAQVVRTAHLPDGSAQNDTVSGAARLSRICSRVR